MKNYPNSSVLYDMLMSVLGQKPVAPGEPPPLDKEPDISMPPRPPIPRSENGSYPEKPELDKEE
jgi:hypothetical protein